MNDERREKELRYAHSLANRARELVFQRYLRGAEGHQAEPALYELSVDELIDHAIEEAVDQLEYLLAMRDRRAKEHTITGEAADPALAMTALQRLIEGQKRGR